MSTPTCIEERGAYVIVYRDENDFAAMLTNHWATTDQHVNCVGCEYVAEGCESAQEVRDHLDAIA